MVRRINLTPIFPLGEFGTYRIKATIFDAENNKYYSSPILNIEITEGRLLWQQTVGVPPGAGDGKQRTISLLANRLPQTTMLYVRVEDKDSGITYCTSQLGRFVAFENPDVQFDASNQLYILQNTAPKAFLLTQMDINGKVIKQTGYQMTNTRPTLIKNADMSVSVAGGVLYDPFAPPPEKKMPKMSDRPVPLPNAKPTATPDEGAPKHLLNR